MAKYTVNDRSRLGHVELVDDASNADIVHELISAGYLDPSATTLAAVNDQGDGLIDINQRNGRPVLSLELDSAVELTQERKVALYRIGKYEFPVPPVYSGNWDESDWIRYIDRSGRWITEG